MSRRNRRIRGHRWAAAACHEDEGREYHDRLVKLERKGEAKLIKGDLALALAKADIKIESNYHCRIDTKREKQDDEKRQGNCW